MASILKPKSYRDYAHLRRIRTNLTAVGFPQLQDHARKCCIFFNIWPDDLDPDHIENTLLAIDHLLNQYEAEDPGVDVFYHWDSVLDLRGKVISGTLSLHLRCYLSLNPDLVGFLSKRYELSPKTLKLSDFIESMKVKYGKLALRNPNEIFDIADDLDVMQACTYGNIVSLENLRQAKRLKQWPKEIAEKLIRYAWSLDSVSTLEYFIDQCSMEVLNKTIMSFICSHDIECILFSMSFCDMKVLMSQWISTGQLEFRVSKSIIPAVLLCYKDHMPKDVILFVISRCLIHHSSAAKQQLISIIDHGLADDLDPILDAGVLLSRYLQNIKQPMNVLIKLLQKWPTLKDMYVSLDNKISLKSSLEAVCHLRLLRPFDVQHVVKLDDWKVIKKLLIMQGELAHTQAVVIHIIKHNMIWLIDEFLSLAIHQGFNVESMHECMIQGMDQNMERIPVVVEDSKEMRAHRQKAIAKRIRWKRTLGVLCKRYRRFFSVELGKLCFLRGLEYDDLEIMRLMVYCGCVDRGWCEEVMNVTNNGRFETIVWFCEYLNRMKGKVLWR